MDVSGGKGNKSKNELLGPHQNKKLLHSKGNNHQTKRQWTEWKKIFANDISDKGLVSKIYKELIRLNTQNTKTPVNKWAKDMNRHFSKEDIQMANQHMKRCSTSLIIREIQIKTTVRNHLTSVRKTNINNSGSNRCCQECRERGAILQLVGMQTGSATLENSWRFLKKLKIELPYNPEIILLGIYPKDTKMLVQRGTCIPMFITAALSIIAKLRKEPKCPLIDK